MANTYYVCPRMSPPKQFPIDDDQPADDAQISYYIRTFRCLERGFANSNLKVVIAWGANIPIPVFGADVVVVIYGDESCRIPPYVNRVAAVFKTIGAFPHFMPRLRPIRLAQIEAAEFLRNLAHWTPHGWRWLISSRVRRKCQIIPLGYQFPSNLPPRPLRERRYLVSFKGSLASPQSSTLRAIVGTPKKYARTALRRNLERLAVRHGAQAVKLSLTESYYASTADGGRSYFEELADTMICVAPRGTSRETFRVFEGLQLGCIVIADRLPDHDFYRGSPIIQLDDWDQLGATIARLTADAGLMEDLHQAGLRYWREVLCEEALAARIARSLGLQALDDRSTDQDRQTPACSQP